MVLNMPQYYFGIETVTQGDKPDPETDKIIAIHYQKIDFRSGKPLQKIEILKEWESSEEAIVTQFYNKFFRGGHNKWIFIPVGFDLNQAWEYIDTKFEQYLGRTFVNKRFHYTIPHIDLDSMIVLLNKGNFIGAKLEKFTKHPSGKRDVKQWYGNQEYDRIVSHINSSAESFLVFFTKVKENVHRVLEDAPALPTRAPAKKVPRPEPKPVPMPVPKTPTTPPPPPPVEEPASEEPSLETEEPVPSPESEEVPPEELPPEIHDAPEEIPEELPPEVPEEVYPPEPEEAHMTADVHEPEEVPEIAGGHHVEDVHEAHEYHEEGEVHEVETYNVAEEEHGMETYHDSEEAHEVAEIHEGGEVQGEEVHEVTEMHDHDHHAEFAPEAIAVEAVEEHDDHAEVVEVEAVEAMEAEAVEVEAVSMPPQKSLSPKELKKRLKEEAKQKKKEMKARAKKK